MQQVRFKCTTHWSKIKLSSDSSVNGEGLVEKESPLEKVFHFCSVEGGDIWGQTELFIFKNFLASLEFINRLFNVEFGGAFLFEFANIVAL